MGVKAREQEAKGREFVDSFINHTRWIKPVKLDQVTMIFPPLLCRCQVPQYEAHSHGQDTVGNSTQQRRVDGIGSFCLVSRTGSFTSMLRPGNNIASDAKQVDSGQTKKGTDACVESNGRALPEQFCQYRNCIVCIIIVVDRIT